MKQILVLLFLFTGDVFCQWHRVSPDSITSGIGALLFNQDKVFAAGANLYVSTDDGQNWHDVITPGYFNGWVHALASDSNRLYVGTGYGFHFSTNNGTNWFRSGIFTENIRDLAAMGQYVIAGTFASNNVYRSTDYGIHWSLQPPLPNVGLPVTESMYSAYGKFFVGTDSAGSYVSSDSGSTWKKVGGMGLTGEGVMLSSYLAFGGKLFLAANYVYCSADSGSSWQLLQGSPWAPMALAAKGGLLFAAGPYGVSESSDSGKTWRTINEGFPDNHWCMAIVATNDYLVAAVYSEGIWIMPLSKVTGIGGVHDVTNRSFSLSQNYPNPFNPSTTISFTLSSKSVVSLKIFDVLGKEVATLVQDEMLSAGTYSKQWNASVYCSGLYFYRLQAGTYLDTKKLILLR
jgi:hypothetical protein